MPERFLLVQLHHIGDLLRRNPHLDAVIRGEKGLAGWRPLSAVRLRPAATWEAP